METASGKAVRLIECILCASLSDNYNRERFFGVVSASGKALLDGRKWRKHFRFILQLSTISFLECNGMVEIAYNLNIVGINKDDNNENNKNIVYKQGK